MSKHLICELNNKAWFLVRTSLKVPAFDLSLILDSTYLENHKTF